MESFCPFKLHEMENFQTKKADAEMVSALGGDAVVCYFNKDAGSRFLPSISLK